MQRYILECILTCVPCEKVVTSTLSPHGNISAKVISSNLQSRVNAIIWVNVLLRKPKNCIQRSINTRVIPNIGITVLKVKTFVIDRDVMAFVMEFIKYCGSESVSNP